MPDQPAGNIFKFSWNSGQKHVERLATAEELAEYGPVAPDPLTESKILALFEEQLLRDLVKDASNRPGELHSGEAAAENLERNSAETNKSTGEATQCAVEERVPAEAYEILKEQAVQEELEASDEDATETSAEPEVQCAEEAEAVIEMAIEEPIAADAGEMAIAAESPVTSTDLLGYAQALDQHRRWIESSGAEGTRGNFSGADLAEADLTAVNLQGADLQKANLRGADLSMTNLRNANLLEADLREANLLGTEFSGANLMGANLYGAQGLWAGRLGGTNLFDATLPEAVAALTGRKTIEQFTQAARWFYALLMALCVGACGLIALTTDVRLLLDESATVTARIPKILPLRGFYLGAPLLLTMLYLRLQFLFLRLWGSMGALPAVFPDGQTPEKDGRWYLMGPIRPYLRWSREAHSALGMVESYVSMMLAYWVVPATLFFFWLRYLVLQDYRGTLMQVVLFTIAGAAACGMPRLVKRVLRPGDWSEESTPQFMHDVLKATRLPVFAGLALFLLSLGVIKGLPGDSTLRPEVKRSDPRRWAATAFQFVGYRPYADLTDESISTGREPENPVAPQSSDANGPRLNEINLRYARGYHAAFAYAHLWRANLEGTSLAETDFRGANLREANMRSAKMDRLLAEKANLVSVDARGASFNGGDFRSSDWSYANLQGATLATTNLTGATMYSVDMGQANLLRADLSHADLRDTKLQGAMLSLARLEQTDFSAAKMAGVNLTGAQAKGTIFLEADLSKADLRGATFAGAVLRQVKLDGAMLMGADFRGALGLESWQVCSAEGWRGAQFDADVKAAVELSCGTPQASLQP